MRRGARLPVAELMRCEANNRRFFPQRIFFQMARQKESFQLGSDSLVLHAFPHCFLTGEMSYAQRRDASCECHISFDDLALRTG